ncbi:MAG TPA: hypothetical protein VGQ36_08910 [Thermoanaerobaculia bacterium]|jgi:hypothetical protein|nr:hypothetical protein [Thermoanaerobaculia bacterium]
MTLTTRLILILTLILTIAIGVSAQETSTTSTATDTVATTTAASTSETETSTETISSYELRNTFTRIVREHPDDVATILALDPTLLSNEQFLAGYPRIGKFLTDHPEVRRNPRFFLGEFSFQRERSRGLVEEILEGLFVLLIFAFIAFALAWFIRTVIEQKRWNRLSRTQTEVHNKILDRFGSSEELLTYIKTDAGTKFLESAPIPLRSEPVTPNAPLTRIMWSIQVGVVVAAGALGMLLVSGRFEKEAAQEMFAMGMIGFSIGAGFIVSAVVSIILSKRLGLWKDPNPAESELVR